MMIPGNSHWFELQILVGTPAVSRGVAVDR